MPRTYPPRRTHVGFRLDPADFAAVEALAAEETDGDRSDMLRRLIREALAARGVGARTP